MIVLSSCHGCSGCNACHCSGAAAAGGGGGRPRADAPINDAERKAVEDVLRRMREQKKGKDRKKEGVDAEAEVAAPANVVVRLPASASLWVDQVSCPLQGTERSFDTPALEPGQRYVYTLRVEFERDGQRVQESRRVPLVAGRRVEVDFDVAAVSTAAN